MIAVFAFVTVHLNQLTKEYFVAERCPRIFVNELLVLNNWAIDQTVLYQ